MFPAVSRREGVSEHTREVSEIFVCVLDRFQGVSRRYSGIHGASKEFWTGFTSFRGFQGFSVGSVWFQKSSKGFPYAPERYSRYFLLEFPGVPGKFWKGLGV